MKPYSRQNVTQEDIDSVVSVLKSDFLTQGPMVTRFENEIGAWCGVDHAVAVNNATAALHLACLALGVDSESTVWVAAVSFVASANCARYCGAKVEFVDVDPETGLICVDTLEANIRSSLVSGKALPKVLIVVHLGGQSCDMEAIAKVCQRYDIHIIEDACHALGGHYLGKPVGSCHYSDCTIFSFHPVKTITSGEGGMLVTNNSALASRARLLSSHGIERMRDRFQAKPKGEWWYEQQELGFNYRLSDIHAALGLSQAQRLDSIVASKRVLAEVYKKEFERRNGQVIPVRQCKKSNTSWHLYPVLFQNQDARDIAYSTLRENGFGVNIHYEPIPLQPYYQKLGGEGEFGGARAYSSRTLSLPMYELLDESEIFRIVDICSRAATVTGPVRDLL